MKTIRKELNLADFGVLAVIFFGYFIYLSLWMYLNTSEVQAPSAASFSDDMNIFSILLELLFLTLAGSYLWWRKFDFSVLKFPAGKNTVPQVLLLLLLGGLAIDFAIYGTYWITHGITPFSYLSAWSPGSGADLFGHITVWLLLFSLLNGFFEELFFMGLTFAVDSKYRIYAIVASVFIRFGFHVYQGLSSAVGIALLGVVFILVRRKVTSLVPFMLAHSVFDVLGSGVLFWVWLLVRPLLS